MDSDSIKLLIIEDEDAIRRGISAFFADSGYDVVEACNGEDGVNKFRIEQPDLVFTDLRMPVLGGLDVIKLIREQNPDTPIIVISGTGAIRDAVEALKLGAWDYVEKPVHDFDALEHMACKAIENTLLRHQVAGLKNKLLSGGIRNPEIFSAIVTRSPALLSIFQYIEVIGPSPQPVMICGETGTGKELFANAVHKASGRKGGFVALNVAGLDDHMFSDVLFGHVRGAFTGADRVREGMIAQAARGTLFLDEIGDLKESSQIKLLRLLQEGEYFPLGSDHPRKSEARIVLATHRNLTEMVAKETFRQDLYYRLFAHQVVIPPLRNREDDIPLLLEHYLQEAAESFGKKKPTVPPELIEYLKAYRFPGNVRELKAMVYEAVTRHAQGVLSMETFLKAMGKNVEVRAASPSTGTEVIARGSAGEYVPTLDEAENLLIDQAMLRANNNQGIAAGYLGINRSALNKKLLKRRNGMQ
ncbi:MAG: sigma-54 dependent transcriptional regulator [Geobacteraceae bacterium]|nr:sigma-54 dependent transcriptional regulator [Geobacteraceae bacterium]